MDFNWTYDQTLLYFLVMVVAGLICEIIILKLPKYKDDKFFFYFGQLSNTLVMFGLAWFLWILVWK